MQGVREGVTLANKHAAWTRASTHPDASASSRLALPWLLLALFLPAGGCQHLVQTTDRDVAALIERRQHEAMGYNMPVPLGEEERSSPEPDRAAYERNPSPSTIEIPQGFQVSRDPQGGRTGPASSAPATQVGPTSQPATASQPVASAPAQSMGAAVTGKVAASQPTRFRDEVFTLTDALMYAQQHRREYQSAKEDLYLAALALTLEQHLWTPQFAGSLRGVYGNFGEVTDFDQATRFVADLSLAQRLPYGGEFTAAAVSTLIRDVKRSITASEGSTISLGLDIPLLRNAGHVAQENLVQLERSLTYAVRSFERFRRAQLVNIADRYFSLLASKQAVIDVETSLRDAERDYERAKEFQEQEQGTILETGRAEAQFLSFQNALASQRESFRAATDQFKIAIGMPVDEPIGLDDLETIETIEQQVAEGRYPLLRQPPAANDDERAIEVATQHRLDLLTRRDQIDDAKRGVAIARNALLPDLDWTSSLNFDTDPDHYKLGAFEVARATWRTEVVLSMNDRFRERNSYRASRIDVRRAQRAYVEQLERIRAQVLSTVNQIRLQERVLRIQRRQLEVNARQREFARIQFEDGVIDNQALVDAENLYINARNRLSAAKTNRWTSLLEFRLATGTLRIDENGAQHDDPALHEQPPTADRDVADTPQQPAGGAAS